MCVPCHSYPGFPLSSPSQIQDAEDAEDLQFTAGQVEFDRVCFSYVPGCVAINQSVYKSTSVYLDLTLSNCTLKKREIVLTRETTALVT